MKHKVMIDLKDYVREHGRLILLSMVTAVLCFGFLAFGENIRIDTEELINMRADAVISAGRFRI